MSRSERRARVVGALAAIIARVDPGRPSRVAIDGITAAGKTTLADEVAAALADSGRPTIRLSMDGFHHPSAHRHRQGPLSARGYYEDAYDLAAFATQVLVPLGPGGEHRYRPAIIDLAADRAVEPEPVVAPDDAMLVVDGTFLQRPELAPHWDLVVWVDTDPAVARARGIARDTDTFGGADTAATAYDARYHGAARLYVAEVQPARSASIVVGNDDLDAPTLLTRAGV